MHQLFRKFFLLPVLILILSNSCKEKESYMNDGIITGFDLRECACCGGLMITFTNDPKPYSAEFKLIENEADLGITDKDTFPIYVKVDWKESLTSACNRIIITRFVRR
jgi:hypothetical protein